ncbi:TlpA disulfide reductase family protein [Massilibacteroides sp.]|uniref:TlpA family protein disulfide reductase n=1 Tax=Massilibacteroides sp. TaxID=2034766 RepID=UPI00260C0DD8|nr:TlpA disulfide reductase family protein [Massilibacteroides sp.]MDD4514183.1 TlpA disulfide reductase family protein [Massilibacteroides sp.]
MKRITTLVILLCISFLITSCDRDDCKDCKEKTETGNVQIGDVLPDFSVKLSSGDIIDRKSLEGKISVILFFSTTCPDCRALFPSIERIYKENKDNEKFIFLAIGRAQSEDVVRTFMEENNYTFPYSPQETRDIYDLFAPSIVPRVYISNSKTTVEEVFIDNPLATYDEMKDIIDKLIEELCCKA